MPTSPTLVPTYLPAPAPMRALVAGLSGAAGLLGLVAAGLAARNSPGPLWAVVCLQLLLVPGGVFGVLWSRGRFAAGPVLALLCAAGTVGLPAMLSYIAHRGVLGPAAMKWWCLAELACAGGLTVLALASAIARDAALRAPALRGLLLALPAAVLAVIVVFGGRLGLDAAMAKLPTLVRLSATGLVGTAAAIMLCMSAHFLSIAFGGAVQAGRRADA